MFAEPNIAGDLCHSGILIMSHSRCIDSHQWKMIHLEANLWS